MREHLESIERRVNNGVRLKKIHAEFIAAGHSASFRNFESALYRARKRRRAEGGVENVAPSPVAIPAPNVGPNLADQLPAKVAHQPDTKTQVAPGAKPVDDYFKRKPLIKKSP
ncbi:MAG: hypothetical protein ACOVSV_05990 [Fimbriimonadaceae bacterium]